MTTHTWEEGDTKGRTAGREENASGILRATAAVSKPASFLVCDLGLHACISFWCVETHLVLERSSYLVSQAKHVSNQTIANKWRIWCPSRFRGVPTSFRQLTLTLGYRKGTPLDQSPLPQIEAVAHMLSKCSERFLGKQPRPMAQIIGEHRIGAS